MDVNLVQTTVIPPGSGTISGTIRYIPYAKSILALGDPVPGAEIYIEQEPNDEPAGQQMTDGDGNYEFDNLGDATYSMVIDIPGLTMVSTYENIQVGASSTTYPDLNFYVDTINGLGISTDSTMIVTPFSIEPFSISVYPNPYLDYATIDYTLNHDGQVIIDIFDGAGKLVESVENTNQQTGEYQYRFNGSEAGIYIVYFRYNNEVYVKKLIKSN